MSHRRAFTLVEMVITLSVFIFLAGMVFAILMSVLQTTTQLEENRNRGDTASALHAFLRSQLLQPSAEDQMLSYHLEGNAPALKGLAYRVNGHWTALDPIPQANGLYTLRVGTEPLAAASTIQVFLSAVVARDSHLFWTILQRDVRLFDWRFLNFNATQWTDTWENPGQRPNLAECTFAAAGEDQPAVMDLWIPNVRAAEITPVSPATNSVQNVPNP